MELGREQQFIERCSKLKLGQRFVQKLLERYRTYKNMAVLQRAYDSFLNPLLCNHYIDGSITLIQINGRILN